jgi:sensor domain CHASE-containing protein
MFDILVCIIGVPILLIILAIKLTNREREQERRHLEMLRAIEGRRPPPAHPSR